MIVAQHALVYYAPTRKRRYFSLKAAVNAEATTIILNRYPEERFESDTGHYYHIKFDEPERYCKMHRRLSKLILNCYKFGRPG